MLAIVKDLIRYNIEFAIGCVLVGVIVVFALASFFSPVDPTLIYVAIPDQPPSGQYWFGTNSRGQDMFWQLSFAFRNTLTFGLMVAVLSRIISISVGLLAGYLGGWVDRVLMFFNDIFVALPIFPILILFYFVMRSDLDMYRLAFVMACFGWPFDARLIRSVALGLRHREFTRHAVFSGMSARRIMFEEHLPYVMPIVFATAIANMIWSIGMEVTLAVLGFTNVNIPTVGTTLYWANNHSAMVVGVWWWILIPVLLIVMLFIGLFLLTVAMNEYIDPRSRLRRMGGA
ncbi:ABC transporter permease [Pelagibacterium lentulum]|uniref:Peptide ABC transporter n=1 Tax=Pelagibacterium lentulum TaxID=2029865 RepID=A0A916RB49_9HYPH|nr:ABC transporter permease [Pelagibacterium lentulum]GGA41907.1 peptide ABC transporter [Pelagibacterium lentulum]